MWKYRVKGHRQTTNDGVILCAFVNRRILPVSVDKLSSSWPSNQGGSQERIFLISNILFFLMILHSLYSSDACKLFRCFYIILQSTTVFFPCICFPRKLVISKFNSCLSFQRLRCFYGDIGDLIKTHRRSRLMRLVISLTELLRVLSICAEKGR